MKHCDRVSRMWLVLAVSSLWLIQQGSQQEDQAGEQTDPLSENSAQCASCAPAKREVSLFRRGWIAQIVALWKGEILLWQHSLQPHPLPQPQLDRLFFDSS